MPFCEVFASFILTGGPLRDVFADESCKNLHDGGVVPGGVFGDAFKGVDPTDANVACGRAELFDGLRVSFGNLTLLGQFGGPLGGYLALFQRLTCGLLGSACGLLAVP